MRIKTVNLKTVSVLLLLHCLQLGICRPQFFSAISFSSNGRTNNNSGNLPFNIRIKSPVSGFFGNQNTRQNQYPIRSENNKQNSYDNYKSSNGYREEVESKDEIEYQNRNEEQNRVEVHRRTGAFDAVERPQTNVEQGYKLQPDTNYVKEVEPAKDSTNFAENEVIYDINTEPADDIETTTSTDEYETTTDDYGLDNRSAINGNVVASLLG